MSSGGAKYSNRCRADLTCEGGEFFATNISSLTGLAHQDTVGLPVKRTEDPMQSTYPITSPYPLLRGEGKDYETNCVVRLQKQSTTADAGKTRESR